jgi:putative membrane protein
MEDWMTRRLLAAASVMMLTASLGGCEQPGTTVTNNVSGTPDGGADEPGMENLTASAGPVYSGQSPAQFVNALAASDLFEIQSGKLAQQKGQSAEVRGFGAMLVDEHTKASGELLALLGRSNPPITPPAVLPPDLQAKLQQLALLSGDQFDQRWLAEQTASHQQTLALVNGFLATAQPGPLKDHAAKATGIVQKHLNEFNQAR